MSKTVILSCCIYFWIIKTKYRNIAADTSDAAARGRESRQQGGDTYTLEIAFPAVK